MALSPAQKAALQAEIANATARSNGLKAQHKSLDKQIANHSKQQTNVDAQAKAIDANVAQLQAILNAG